MGEQNTAPVARKITRAFNESQLFQNLGFCITALEENSLVLEISGSNACHRGGFGFLEDMGINGAVVSAAMESAMGICGFISFGGAPAGVIEMSVKMLRIVRKKPCRIEARIDRKSNSLCFVSAVLRSASGGVCATASGIVSTVSSSKNIGTDSDNSDES